MRVKIHKFIRWLKYQKEKIAFFYYWELDYHLKNIIEDIKQEYYTLIQKYYYKPTMSYPVIKFKVKYNGRFTKEFDTYDKSVYIAKLLKGTNYYYWNGEWRMGESFVELDPTKGRQEVLLLNGEK